MMEVSELVETRALRIRVQPVVPLSKAILINPEAQHHCEGCCRKAAGEGEACWTAEPIQP